MGDRLRTWLKFLRYDTTPHLDSFEAVITFTQEQAAFVTQVTLYPYIKTRAGTQYPKLFENETFLTSLRIARWHIYAACISDLSLFITARLVADNHCADAHAGLIGRNISQYISGTVLDRISQEDIDASLFDKIKAQMVERCKNLDYDAAGQGDYSFKSSADALLRWAPVADEFKQLDEQILRNSIHLRWISVRRDVAGGMHSQQIYEEWLKWQPV